MEKVQKKARRSIADRGGEKKVYVYYIHGSAGNNLTFTRSLYKVYIRGFGRFAYITEIIKTRARSTVNISISFVPRAQYTVRSNISRIGH